MRISIRQLKKLIREGLGGRGPYWEDDEKPANYVGFDDDGNPLGLGHESSSSVKARYERVQANRDALQRELGKCRREGADETTCQMLTTQIDSLDELLNYLWDQFN